MDSDDYKKLLFKIVILNNKPEALTEQQTEVWWKKQGKLPRKRQTILWRKGRKTTKMDPDQYRGLFEEEKNKKKEYARNRYHMSEEDKQKPREQK